jgi:hypothetical protein
MIDLPDFGSPMRSMADSLDRIADATPGARPAEPDAEDIALAGNSGTEVRTKGEVHHA